MKWLTRLFKIGKALREIADVVDEIEEAQGVLLALASIPDELEKATRSGEVDPQEFASIVGRHRDLTRNTQRILNEIRQAIRATASW